MNEFDEYLRWGPVQWPPKVYQSLEYGGSAYAITMIYLQGMSKEEFAEYAADGILNFWAAWGVGPGLSFIITSLLILLAAFYLLYRHWQRLGRAFV